HNRRSTWRSERRSTSCVRDSTTEGSLLPLLLRWIEPRMNVGLHFIQRSVPPMIREAHVTHGQIGRVVPVVIQPTLPQFSLNQHIITERAANHDKRRWMVFQPTHH